MAHNVYTAEYHGVRNHIALFVRPSDADSTASGKCFHIIGTILNGMKARSWHRITFQTR